jgi:hypothetical protein
MAQPTVLGDLEEFVTTHRSRGELSPEVGHPTPNGYMLEVACSCDVTFERGRGGGAGAGATTSKEPYLGKLASNAVIGRSSL